MNGTDFSRYVADKYGTTYKDTSAWTKAVIESIGDVLVSGEDLVITNFGTFRTYISPPQKGRNRYTGEPIDIPERRRVKLILCPALRNMINEQFELDSGIEQSTKVRMEDIALPDDDDDE